MILLFIINKIPGMHIRATEDDELRGLDYKYFHDIEGDMEILNGYGAATPGMTRSGVVSDVSHEGVEVPVASEKRD